jgi:hypothetical protein
VFTDNTNDAKIRHCRELTFTKLQFVENGGLSGGIETNHQDTHLFLAELS